MAAALAYDDLDAKRRGERLLKLCGVLDGDEVVAGYASDRFVVAFTIVPNFVFEQPLEATVALGSSDSSSLGAMPMQQGIVRLSCTQWGRRQERAAAP